LDELRLLAAAGDLSLATRSLMDLFADFPLENAEIQPLKGKATYLRANFNQSGNAEEALNETTKKEMWVGFLALLDEVEEVLTQQVSNAKQVSTFEDAQHEFLKDKYLIFNPESIEAKENLTVFEGLNITKGYKSVRFRLSSINLTLRAGEITGIVGENGNGKTTLLNIVAGELSIDSGTISYPAFEKSTLAYSNHQAIKIVDFDAPASFDKPAKQDWYNIKHHIAFIPQHLEKWTGLLKDNLHLSAANHGIFGQENEEAVDFIIHRLGLTRYKQATWKDISSGYKLRFELARALVWRPKLLILDEPLGNLDINSKLLFMQDLRLLSNSLRYPIAILMSSQQLHEIENVVDNIVFLQEGNPIYNGKVSEFGKDRSTNVFELSGDFSRIDLHNWLKNFQTIKIEDTGQSFIIETPIEFTGNQLLALLSEKQKIDYFRDISQSTRKLFQK
jgi:ABC-2 type transport system ATP-binding protein